MRITVSKEKFIIATSSISENDRLLEIAENLTRLLFENNRVEKNFEKENKNICKEKEIIKEEQKVYDKPTLVMTKCKKCGTVYARMVNIRNNAIDSMACECGEEQLISYEMTQKAEYECECGSHYYFRVTDDVKEIKCKSCNKSMYLVWDDDERKYKGCFY